MSSDTMTNFIVLVRELNNIGSYQVAMEPPLYEFLMHTLEDLQQRMVFPQFQKTLNNKLVDNNRNIWQHCLGSFGSIALSLPECGQNYLTDT